MDDVIDAADIVIKPEPAAQGEKVQESAIQVLANGAERQGNRIVKGAPLTREGAQELAKLRWEKYRQQRLDGAAEGMGVKPDDVVHALHKKAGHIVAKGADRESLKAIEFLAGKFEGDLMEGKGGLRVTLEADAETLDTILEIVHVMKEAKALRS